MANKSLLTPEGRTSFMKVYRPEDNMNGTAKVYSVKLMFPKSMNMDWIINPWKELARIEFGKENPPGLRPLFSAGNPFDDKGAIMDGDWKYNNTEEERRDMYADYRDHWIMGFTAPEARPPAIVGPTKEEIIDQSLFQSGDYARVSFELSMYYSKKYHLNMASIRFAAIQKTRDGIRFGSGLDSDTAVDMFGEVKTDNDGLGDMI